MRWGPFACWLGKYDSLSFHSSPRPRSQPWCGVYVAFRSAPNPLAPKDLRGGGRGLGLRAAVAAPQPAALLPHRRPRGLPVNGLMTGRRGRRIVFPRKPNEEA